jgi:hypothetical protein
MPVLSTLLTVIVAAGGATSADKRDNDKMQRMSDSSKMQGMSDIKLDGSREVPPVKTTAAATGAITVSAV